MNRTFTLAFSNQALSTVGQYALLLVVPILLDARGWGPVGGGLVLAALTIGMVVVSPAGGRLGDRRDRRSIILFGTAVAAGTLAVFVGVAILAGMLAAILPARRASRLNVLEALQYE